MAITAILMRYVITFLISLLGFSSVLFAFEEPLKNAYEEQRAKEIFKSLKCQVCEGQSVLDSESTFAISLRQLVRGKIEEGLNDEQIYDLIRSSYGQNIMFKPPFDGATALLWVVPFALIFIGFIAVILVLRRNKSEAIQI